MNKMGIEEYLDSQKRLFYRVKGDSMMPLIREKEDVVILVPKEAGRLQVGDVPLYKRETGEYVLHRIIKVKKDSYWTRGDNRFSIEKGVRDDMVLGVLSGIIRKGHTTWITDEDYQEYLRRQNSTYWKRWCKQKIKRIFERLRYGR